jgi:hypothetical protein
MRALCSIITRHSVDSDLYQCILRHPSIFRNLLSVLSAQVDLNIELNVNVLTDCLWMISSLTFEPKVTCLLVEIGLPQVLSAFYLQHFITDGADNFYEPGHVIPAN